MKQVLIDFRKPEAWTLGITASSRWVDVRISNRIAQRMDPIWGTCPHIEGFVLWQGQLK